MASAQATNLRIVTSKEMQELDHLAETQYGIEAMMLMENAGRSATEIILEQFPQAGKQTEVLIFAGKGNNAGDAFVVARRLLCLERRVRVFHLQHASGYREAALKNFEILRKMKAKLNYLENAGDLQAFFERSHGPFTLIDGILGTGFKGTLEGLYYEVVELMNHCKSHEGTPADVIALDIPTGVHGDTGSITGTSVLADLTISFGFPKLGHFLPPGAARRGALVNVDISLPPRFRREGELFLLTKSPLGKLLHERDKYGHKNSFGHSLLVGGSPGRLGAIVMAARACHKMGTGLVTVATWEECFDALSSKVPNETMVVPMKMSGPEYDLYKKSLHNYSSIVIGPGLGLRSEGKKVIEELLLFYSGPIVLDADALNLIAEYKLHSALKKRRSPTVLTPHPGEMARFLGQSKESVLANPIQAVKEAVSQTLGTVVLKGAATLIGSPDEALYLNHYPNDGMATAGSGDVLAGMIGGLLGQKIAVSQGTLLGVYLHSIAGGFAARDLGHRSMTAHDIIENISNAIRDIKTLPESALPLEGKEKLL